MIGCHRQTCSLHFSIHFMDKYYRLSHPPHSLHSPVLFFVFSAHLSKAGAAEFPINMYIYIAILLERWWKYDRMRKLNENERIEDVWVASGWRCCRCCPARVMCIVAVLWLIILLILFRSVNLNWLAFDYSKPYLRIWSKYTTPKRCFAKQEL